MDSRIKLSQLKNPETSKPTSTFVIKLFDKNSEGIAEIQSGNLYYPQAGEINDVSLVSLGSIEIADITDIKLDFTPVHDVYGGVSSILLIMPEQLTFSCNIDDVVGLIATQNCEDLGDNRL